MVRNWYARFPQITENADNLIKNAEEAVVALKEGKKIYLLLMFMLILTCVWLAQLVKHAPD